MSYIFINPEDREDKISITKMDDDFWVARRFSDPRTDIATLRNWKDNPLIATSESWNCREGQRNFWNRVLRKWKLSNIHLVYGTF